jgi:chromosome segregation protein
LGGALQHVVVTDERAARAAIQFLKQNRLGRATFLPLNVIQGRSIVPSELHHVKQMEGFLGVANELVTTEPRFAKIVAQLLGNVLVTETLEVANQVAKVFHHRYRVVTVAGDVVNPGGSMTGGSRQSKAPNLLARSRQLEESQQQLQILRQQQMSLQAEEQQLEKKLDELRLQQRERAIGSTKGYRITVARISSSTRAYFGTIATATTPATSRRREKATTSSTVT